MRGQTEHEVGGQTEQVTRSVDPQKPVLTVRSTLRMVKVTVRSTLRMVKAHRAQYSVATVRSRLRTNPL